MSMSNITRSTARRWFGRVVWIGIVANLALAIPTVFAPERMMTLSGVPLATPTTWTQFSAFLLIILSTFYIPAAIDPDRYRVIAWLTVISRLAGTIFFTLFQPAVYHRFGYFDLVFLVPEALLLAALAAQPEPAYQPRAGAAV
jgi:hypothetical protein